MRKIVAFLFCLLPFAQACEPEDNYVTAFECDVEKVSVNLSLKDIPLQTRSSLGENVEDIISGFSVLVSFHDSGLVEGVYELGSDGSFEVTAGVPLDFRVVGNLWYIDSQGNMKSYLGQHGTSGVDLPFYRLDGKNIGGGLRTEKFSEISKYGIPFSGSLESVTVSQGLTLSIPVERMLAKVTVNVDHSGLTGGKPGVFKDSSIRLCQASCLLHPFLPVKAESAEDMLAAGDYEPELSDSERTSYTLYVPENISGVTLDNKDPSNKTKDNLESIGKGAREPYLTYVEFCGDLNASAGGYGGGMTYRFYLGSDNISDFNVVRNNNYRITLGFRADSLFDPYWKVETGSDFEDLRLIAFSEDASGDRLLEAGRTVAVRKNRPAVMYLYFNKDGKPGKNQFLSLDKYSDGYEPADASRSACIWSDEGLEKYGMKASYDAKAGKMTISVTDKSLFVAGRTVPVTLRLLPGNVTYKVNVVTFNDISVKGDLKDFYTGMSRNVTLAGFAGGRYYMHSANSGVIKLAPSQDAPYVSSKNTAMNGPSATLYAYGKTSGLKLTFNSDDAFNDGEYTVSFPVYLPAFNAERRSLRLYVDGTSVPLAGSFFSDRNGRHMSEKDFDPDLFEQVLALEPSWSNEYGDRYVGFGENEMYIDYLGDGDTWIGRYLDDGEMHNAHPDFLGSVSVKPKSSLYKEASQYELSVYLPYVSKHFPPSLVSEYYNQYNSSGLTLESEYMTYGNNNLVFETGENAAITSIEDSANPDASILRWYAGDEVANGDVPYGPQELIYGFVNARAKSGTAGVMTKTYVVVSHNVRLGQFAIFDKSPLMKVYVTYPKAAWMLKRYYEGASGAQMPVWNSVRGISSYNNYLTFNYFRTIATGQRQMLAGSGNTHDFYYYDFFPGTYPTMTYWDESKALSVASSLQWLSGLYFTQDPGTSSTNPYYHIYLSQEKIGYVFNKRY